MRATTRARPWWFVVLCLTGVWMQGDARAQVQRPDTSFTLDVRGLPLSEALSRTADAAGFDLAYAPELVIGKTSTCAIENAAVAALLRCVLAGTGLEARRLAGGAFLIRPVRQAPPAPTTGTIRGTVRADSTLEGVAGAHVLVLGTLLGSATDHRGRYLIKRVPEGRYVLTVSSLGFGTEHHEGVRVPAGDTVDVAFELTERPLLLDELAVVAHYDWLTQRIARQIPTVLQSVRVMGMGLGVLVSANPSPVTRMQVSGLGNLAGSDLRGLQLSGGVNYAGADASGVQIGALGNRTGGRLRGVQAGGLFNSTHEEVRGVQVGGVTNIAWGPVVGAQVAGAFNVAASSMERAQVAGLFNVSGALSGVQAAGAFNVTAASVRGVQIAGAVNAADEVAGGQVAGAINWAGGVTGTQVSGAFNRATGPVRGVQVSGLLNVARGEVRGAQIGIVNIARSASGAQIGIVNVAGSSRGVPLGLFSYVREVGLGVDAWGDETGMLYSVVRSGNRHVANFLGVGTRPQEDAFRWAVVLGLGGERPLSTRWQAAADVLYTLTYEETLAETAQWIKLRLLLGYRPLDRLLFFAGPTYNLFLDEDTGGRRLAPWTHWSGRWGDLQYRTWPGFAVGVRLFP